MLTWVTYLTHETARAWKQPVLNHGAAWMKNRADSCGRGVFRDDLVQTSILCMGKPCAGVLCWLVLWDWQWRREKSHFKSRKKQVIAEHLVTVLCIPGKSFNCPVPREALKITGKYLV